MKGWSVAVGNINPVTDNEIVKALECCKSENGNDCEGCPCQNVAYKQGSGGCTNALMGYALDLITRQKNEIISRTEEYNDMLEQRNKVEEALEVMTMDVNSLTSERDALQEMVAEQKAEIERLQCSAKRNGRQIGSLIYHLEQAKSEAYREFAEKVKTKKFTHKNFGELVYVDDIDTTLNELTRNLHGTCTELARKNNDLEE